MKQRNKAAEFLTSLRPHLRSRPGMYFGCGGSGAIPRMLNEFLIAVLENSIDNGRTSVDVSISRGAKQRITIRVRGIASAALKRFHVSEPVDWHNPFGSQLAMILAAAEDCVIRAVDQSHGWQLFTSDSGSFRHRRLATKSQPEISLNLGLHEPTFGKLDASDVHRFASMLRDLSILRQGMAIFLRMGNPDLRLAWQYPQGLKAFVVEMDHSRWPLHADCIEFRSERNAVKVDGCLRFVHAGVPEVRSWINFHATQGGAHYEGLGDALVKLFPAATLGCRSVRFVTNPDTDAAVNLPHPFVGAIHIQMPEPKFAGPTKDILLDDGVRRFVCEVASAALPKQWKELRSRRI